MRATAMAAALLVAGSTLGACATGHNALGTSSSPCYQGLPRASAAVPAKDRLVGVRHTSAATAAHVLGLKQLPPASRGVCLFAFRASPVEGRYAIVGVAMREDRVVGSATTDDLPMRFPHRMSGR